MTKAEAEQQLRARLDQIACDAATNADSRETVELQQDSVGRLSRMDALQQQAMAQATQRRRQAERQRVRAALKRIEQGEWGYCLICGERIAEKRLRHDPSVPHCLGCADGGD